MGAKQTKNRKTERTIKGLKLYEDVIDTETHDELVKFIDEQLVRGRKNELIGSTYTPIPPKWDSRKQGREMLQYGTYTHSNRVYDHEIVVEDMPDILNVLVDELVRFGVFACDECDRDEKKKNSFRPESCTVNIYEKGQWLPPHVDNPNFSRPFCTVSLCADEYTMFGRGIVWPEGSVPDDVHDKASEGEEYRVLCKKNSVIVLGGDAGDVYEHAVLPVRAERRISLTFRKRDFNKESLKKRTELTESVRREYRAKRKEVYDAIPKEPEPETERERIARERFERKKEKERRKIETLEKKKTEAETLAKRAEEKALANKKKEPKAKTHKECLPVPEGLLLPKTEHGKALRTSTNTPSDFETSSSSMNGSEKVNKMPKVEREYVQKVYDVVAKQWHGTRYRSWPAIEKFVANQPHNGFVADVGCGNGKNMIDVIKGGGTVVGMDFSCGLIDICAEQGFEVQVADAVMIPYRSRVFDYALNIAVLHHISSEERRIRMCEETLRIVKVGGVALFCAWAYEQDKGGVSGHDFLAQDVLVPFHKRPIEKGMQPSEQKELDDQMVKEGKAPSHGEVDAEKHTVVYQRYCHVYKEGELEALFEKIEHCKVIASYFDFGNWCVEVRVT